MVTQSTGPYAAVAMEWCWPQSNLKTSALESAKPSCASPQTSLPIARPTTSNRYALITGKCLEAGLYALKAGRDPVSDTFDCALETMNERYGRMQLVGDELLKLIPDGGTILTQCYGRDDNRHAHPCGEAGGEELPRHLRRDQAIYAGSETHLSMLCRDGL